jgi:D-beta-D-heptose 7-phosphate kinase/D-beta-D-heptose 1-phosphate adenosyltransferase
MDIQQLTLLKILVIGDYCQDVFKYGKCERLSPEAPVPVFCFEREIKTEGMSGNVYKNLLALNVQAHLIVSNMDTIKERYIDSKSKQHLLRVDYEKQSEEIKIPKEKLDKYHAIIVSDYNKGSINENNIRSLFNFSGPIFVDSKKPDLQIFDRENVFVKINQDEYNRSKSLPQKNRLIVTMGEKGALYNGNIYPSKKVDVFDVSGAGDTFIAALCVQYLLTNSISEAIIFANLCASSVVSKSGTAIINFEDVKNDLRF